MRLVETAGRACETQVEVHGLNREFTLAFTPFEIKTVRIPVHSQLEILENDLLEREEAHRQED